MLRLCYACVTLGLHLRYAWVTLGLRLRYTCVTLVLRLHYACEFYINKTLCRQLSVRHQSDVSLSSLCCLSSIGQHALRMCYTCVRLVLLLHCAWVTLGLCLCYAWVTLGLCLGYAWVTLTLRLRYACVTLSLRLHYACEFNINIKLSRQLSVCHQSDGLRLRYACVTLVLHLHYAWVTLGFPWGTLALRLRYACVTLALRLRYACEFNINLKLSRQLSVCHQSKVSLMSICHHFVVFLQ